MSDLQARIGPKATKIYPNLSWKWPEADLKFPAKNTLKRSQTRQNDQKEYDSDASSHEYPSSPTASSPTKSRNQSNLSQPRDSSGSLSLLTRMGLSSGVSDGDALLGEEAVSVQQSLLTRVGTIEDTPRNIGSPWRDTAHALDSNGYHDIAHSKPAHGSSLNGQRNAFIAEKQPLDNWHNGSSHDNPNGDQKTCNDELIVKPSTIEASSLEKTLPQSILQDSSKSNYYSSNLIKTSQTRLEDNLAANNNMTVHQLTLSQEKEFEEDEVVGSQPLPSQQVRDYLLPLVLANAAHRVKEGNNDLSRHNLHSVLSDEVCASLMDKMKEVRTEMHARKNRSSNTLQMQLTKETNKPGAAHALPSLKIDHAPPPGPRATIVPIKTGAAKLSSSEDLPTPALSSNPVSPSVQRNRESGFRSPEGRGFHDYDQGLRFSQQRDPRFDGHLSRSHSSSRPSRGQPYYRPSDLSWDRSRSPVTLPTSLRQKWSPPPGPSQSTYFRDHAVREGPEAKSDNRSVSSFGQNRVPERRQSLSRDFKRLDGNISPRWDTIDSPQSTVSRGPFSQLGADKVVSPRRSSFTHHDHRLKFDEPPRPRRDSHTGIAGSALEFVRRSASPSRRKQCRQFSVERRLARSPPPLSVTPNAYYQSSESERRQDWGTATPNAYSRSPEPERRRDWGIATPNAYYQSPKLERRRDSGTPHMGSLSPGFTAGSMSASIATDAHHQTEKPMVVDDQDIHGRAKEEVEMKLPKIDDMQESGLEVLPCHNVPGVWFVKVALDNIGILECPFEVDNVTAINWKLRPAKVHILRKERLQLRICCLLQRDVQFVMDSLKPDAIAQDVATALLTIENNWPTPGHLIIMVNPQDKKNKRIWLPDKLESSCLPVCIEDCIFEGQNIVQFIQLSGMSERMFVLFATARPSLEDLQHDNLEEFVLAPLQNTIDGGKEDVIDIGFRQVVISD